MNLDVLEQVSEDQFNLAFDMYQEVEKSGIIDPNFTYQMEIGLNPFSIFQLRKFKEKAPVAHFEVPYLMDTEIPHITSRLVFGITPKEGIPLDFTSIKEVDFWHGAQMPQGQDYDFIASRIYDSLPTHLRLGALKAFISSSGEHNYLEHGGYRLMKRADYSFIQYFANNCRQSGLWNHNPEDFKMFRKARMWSNGDRGVIVPEEFVGRM